MNIYSSQNIFLDMIKRAVKYFQSFFQWLDPIPEVKTTTKQLMFMLHFQHVIFFKTFHEVFNIGLQETPPLPRPQLLKIKITAPLKMCNIRKALSLFV